MGTDRDLLNSAYAEVLFDISFNVGNKYHELTGQQASDLMDMLNGSRGLMERIKDWTLEFQDAWDERTDEKEDYLSDIDAFADKKWDELKAELARFNAKDGTLRPLREIIVGVQVIPTYGDTFIQAQMEGPDEMTTQWSVYTRRKDGTAAHVADVPGRKSYDTAMLFGHALADKHKVEIETQPWIDPPEERPYLVKWEINVDAASPREAAQKAREIQREPDSTATVFEVAQDNVGAGFERIDLSEPA